jgi:hypothetical protein
MRGLTLAPSSIDSPGPAAGRPVVIAAFAATIAKTTTATV